MRGTNVTPEVIYAEFTLEECKKILAVIKNAEMYIGKGLVEGIYKSTVMGDRGATKTISALREVDLLVRLNMNF